MDSCVSFRWGSGNGGQQFFYHERGGEREESSWILQVLILTSVIACRFHSLHGKQDHDNMFIISISIDHSSHNLMRPSTLL